MKKLFIYALALACSGLHLSATNLTAGFIVNGNFEDDAAPWDYGNYWRDDGAAAVYDAASDNSIFSWGILRRGIDITTNTAFTGDADYDVNTTLLTGFDTDSATFDAITLGFVEGRMNAANADYQIFWEIDVSTADSDYRLKSNSISADDLFSTEGTIVVDGGDDFNTWTWSTDESWAGELTASSIVTFASITNLTAGLVIYVIDTDEAQTETAYWIVDNLALDANVTTVPEPATYALLAGMLAFASIAVRRRR